MPNRLAYPVFSNLFNQMNPLPPTPAPAYAPDPVLAAQPAVRALPEMLRQHLWRAVHVLREGGITVRGIQPQAYALALHLSRPDLLGPDDRGVVLLYYNAQLAWTKSVHQGPDLGLRQAALACLARCR